MGILLARGDAIVEVAIASGDKPPLARRATVTEIVGANSCSIPPCLRQRRPGASR
jgi:hypothetical protein